MELQTIAIFTVMALIAGFIKRGRGLFLLATSAFVIYALQPAEGLGSLAFWLPTLTIGITILAWTLTADPEARSWTKNRSAYAILAAVIMIVDLNRFVALDPYFPPPPRLTWIVSLAIIIASIAFVLLRIQHKPDLLFTASSIFIITIFATLKSPVISQSLLSTFSSLRQDTAITGTAIAWLGFSYIAFRILHTIRDRQMGRLPSVTLEEYANYVIFFPAISAGPIDRIERFTRDLRAPSPLNNEIMIEAGARLTAGLIKKFVLADLLALISINDSIASKDISPLWMWFFLYAYSFRIFFDFSGYTDIAIGIAKLIGIALPENFASPYLKPNLTQFWNSWHMTLTQWFRAYFFNPITRGLRSAKISIPIILLITQLSTMILIGLWHGITINYVLFGTWHGLGLFIQNRWSDFIQPRITWANNKFVQALNIFITFNFVSIGWLFFNLSTPTMAFEAFKKLFGVG